MTVSPFGVIQSRQEVTDAILNTLRTRLLYLIAQVERDEGLTARTLPPPGGSPPDNGETYTSDSLAFRGGIDLETWTADVAPMLIVAVEPTGAPERLDGGEYQQWYAAQIAAVVQAQEQESEAILLADRYGKAIMACVLQHGSLDGFAERTVLTGAPRAEFPDPTRRRIVRTVVEMNVLVERIVDEWQGPDELTGDPYQTPLPSPDVAKTGVLLETLP